MHMRMHINMYNMYNMYMYMCVRSVCVPRDTWPAAARWARERGRVGRAPPLLTLNPHAEAPFSASG